MANDQIQFTNGKILFNGGQIVFNCECCAPASPCCLNVHPQSIFVMFTGVTNNGPCPACTNYNSSVYELAALAESDTLCDWEGPGECGQWIEANLLRAIASPPWLFRIMVYSNIFKSNIQAVFEVVPSDSENDKINCVANSGLVWVGGGGGFQVQCDFLSSSGELNP